MASSANGGEEFELHLSATIAESTRSMLREAIRAGNGKAVLAAFRRIVERLTRHAATFGEPLYHLPTLQLQIRHAVVRPLAVDFAVSLTRHEVYIKGIRVL
jgi:hypothetical protein